MGDETGREPLWPADDEPAPARRPDRLEQPPAAPADPWVARVPPAPLWEPDSPAPSILPMPAAPAISEAQTARIPTYGPSAPQAPTTPPLPVPQAPAHGAHGARDASEAATERIPTAPPAESPLPSLARRREHGGRGGRGGRGVSETPATRLSAAPVPAQSPAPLRATPLRSAPPRPAARPSPPPLPAPLRPPAPKPRLSGTQAALAWARDHWRLLTIAAVALVALITAGGSYAYASSLAAQPQRIVARYCAALVGGDYKTAYGLLAPALRGQTSQAQYVADGAARDTISGKVTACAGAPGQALSALSFLTNPRSVVIPLSMRRATGAQGQIAQGQIALARDATGWHVAGLSAGVAGVDLGPLHAEQALCSAFMARDYQTAYGLLSAPYQHEQGSEQIFARDFGANLAITGCEPALRGYKLDAADQRASFQMTLDVKVSGGGASTKLTMPVTVSLVREQGGWRVDAITPTLGQ